MKMIRKKNTSGINSTLRGFGLSKKNILLIGLHGAISFGTFMCMVLGVAYIVISDLDFYNYEFLVHGLKNTPYFFSLWVSAIQIVYFNMHLIIDIIDFAKRPDKAELKEKLQKSASYILFTLVFPLSLMVCILFWGFYFWNREYIYPTVMEYVYPSWLNHAMHTYPVPLSIVYMATSNKMEPPKRKTLMGLVAFWVVYMACFISAKVINGKWVYPALEYLTPAQRKCTFAFTIFGSIGFLLLGHKLNNLFTSMKKQKWI